MSREEINAAYRKALGGISEVELARRDARILKYRMDKEAKSKDKTSLLTAGSEKDNT